MNERFGKPWDEGIIATTFWDIDEDGKILEADVAINAHYSWTADNDELFGDEAGEAYWHIVITALGNMIRMPAYPEQLSMMGADLRFRPFSLPYPWDIYALRKKYPEAATPRKDMGICMFYVSESGQWEDAEFSATEVRRGDTIEVSKYTLYNVGTTAVKPAIFWFLSPARDVTDDLHGVIVYTYKAVEADTLVWYQGTKLEIPDSVPAGDYYVGAFVKDDESIEIADYPFLNSLAFSRNTIQVAD
jgi:hypothetical protein